MLTLLRDLRRLRRDVGLPRPARGALAVRHVDAGSCNGCEHELTLASSPLHDLARFGIGIVASPRHADVLLVTGPVTTRMREPLLAPTRRCPSLAGSRPSATARSAAACSAPGRARRARRDAAAGRPAHPRLPAVAGRDRQRAPRPARHGPASRLIWRARGSSPIVRISGSPRNGGRIERGGGNWPCEASATRLRITAPAVRCQVQRRPRLRQMWPAGTNAETDHARDRPGLRQLRATHPLDARYACDRCSGRWSRSTTPTPCAPRQPRAHREPAAHPLALPDFLPASPRPARACRSASRRSCRRPGWLRRSACARCWSRSRARTHALVQGPRRQRRLGHGPRLGFTALACASTGNLAGAVAAQAAALGLEAYVFIPADLEREKIIAAAVPGARVFAVHGNYDDVNRLCAELAYDRPLGVREHEPAALLRAGVEDAGLRDRGAARLAAARADRRADRVGPLSRKLDRGFALLDEPASSTATPPRRVRRARPSAARRWPRPGRRERRGAPGAAGHDRQVARDRQRRRTAENALRRGVPHRRRDRGGRRRGDRRGDRPARPHHRLFTETAGGTTVATLTRLARAGTLDPDGTTVVYITGDGLKTPDAALAHVSPIAVEADADAVEEALAPLAAA